MKYATKSIIIIAFLSALLSFAKFDHCFNNNFATPDVYTHACYSDLPALFSARDLIQHAWPYSSATNSVEYPPLTGLVMWVSALPTHSDKTYFLINSGLIALLFVALTILLSRMKPELWYLLPLSPAVIASLYINWDLWAVISTVLAIYFFDRRGYDYSALLLGLSISTKFFPIVLLAPITLIFFRRAQLKGAARYLIVTMGSWLLINAPFILLNRTGWWRFFTMNRDRGVDFGSLWYALNLFGITTRNLNQISIVLFLAGIAIYGVYFFGLTSTPTLASASFGLLVIFTVSSKVYSPQYILWLTPLAILAMRGAGDRRAFWIWQGAEMTYHVAIWEYLASYSGSHFGLPARAYAAATLIRIVATIYFLLHISTRATAPQQPRFLISEERG